MRALGIQQGDEVILPTNTFISTAWAPAYLGATPIFVDCDLYTGNIDPKDVIKKVTKRTKAVIGVHLYGQPLEIEKIQEICKDYKLFFIEDCAQAFGAMYKNNYVGTFGDIGCFSFYPSKNLGAYGDAGAVITKNKHYYDKIGMLKNHGSNIKYHHEFIGYNMRMDSIQAAVLNVKIKYLLEWNKKRQEIAKIYNERIINKYITKIGEKNHSQNVYHIYGIRTKNRDKLKKYLEGKDIYTSIHYPICCHLQKAFKYLGYTAGDFPNSELFMNECLSLPMYPELNRDEIEYVIKYINEYKN